MLLSGFYRVAVGFLSCCCRVFIVLLSGFYRVVVGFSWKHGGGDKIFFYWKIVLEKRFLNSLDSACLGKTT